MRARQKRNGRLSAAGLCLLIATLFVGVAIGVMLHGLFPVIYKMASSRPADQTAGQTVSAYIQVAINPDYVVYRKDRTDNKDYEIFKNTQLGLIKSPYVFMAALRKKNVANLSIVKQENDPLSWLARELQVDYINDSEIMRVAMTSANPNEATELVDAIVDAYLEEVVNKQERERRALSAQLTQIYNSKENEVRSKQASLINLSEKLNVSNSDTAKIQATISIQELSELRSALHSKQMSLYEAQGVMKKEQAKLERLDNTPVSGSELEKLLKADPVCKQLSEGIAQLRETLAQQKQKNPPGGKKAPDTALAKRLAAMEKEYKIRENELREMIKGSRRAELEEGIAAAQVQVAILTEQVKDLSARVDIQREKVSEIGKSSVDIEMMKAELDALEKTLADIRIQREKLDIESRARPRITRQSTAQLESK